MSTEEQRLARLLKRMVPEPPAQLSADEITTRLAAPSARSWTLPALAAAAVAAIGVTVGLVAAHQPGPGRAPAAQPLSSASASASPQVSVTCLGRTVTVPNVVGVTQNAALAIIQDAGLEVGVYYGVPPGSARIAVGSIFALSPPAGSKAVPGALVWLEIATSRSTSTAAPLGPEFAPTAAPPPSPCQVVTGSPPPSNATQSVPDVVGMTANQAHFAARASGFSVSTVTTAAPTSGPVAPGTVFAQSPAAGSTAIPHSGMILYVAPAS